MIAIRHDDVIDWTVAEDRGTRLACHRRGIDENLVFSDRQEEPIEIELLLLGKPRPLPDTGKELFHWISELEVKIKNLLNLSLGLPKERRRHL